MASWHSPETDTLCEALLMLKNREDCYAFLEDICTIREVQDISQRLSVAILLSKKENYHLISQKTGASTATISRVFKSYEYGADGYKRVIKALNGEKHD